MGWEVIIIDHLNVGKILIENIIGLILTSKIFKITLVLIFKKRGVETLHAKKQVTKKKVTTSDINQGIHHGWGLRRVSGILQIQEKLH